MTLTEKLDAATQDFIQERADSFLQFLNKGSQQAKNVPAIVAFGFQHPSGPVANILDELQALLAKRAKHAKSKKVRNIGIHYSEPVKSAPEGKKLSKKCTFCRTSIRHGQKVRFAADGKALGPKGSDFLVGGTCYQTLVNMINGSHNKVFEMIEPKPGSDSVIERVEKTKIPISALHKKVRSRLNRLRYTYNEKIRADLADELSGQVLSGDATGLEREIDPAKYLGFVKWLSSDHVRNLIYKYGDPKSKDRKKAGPLLEAIAQVETNPLGVDDNQWDLLLSFGFEYRLDDADGLLGISKDDILYLAKLSKRKDVHPTIGKYGPLDLNEEVRLNNLYSLTRRKQTLRTLLTKTDSLTLAQYTAIKGTVKRLREQRRDHNRHSLDQYATPEEFNRLFGNLRELYESTRRSARAAYQDGVARPKRKWNNKTVKDFFRLEDTVKKANPDMSTRDVFISMTAMPDADALAETLYIEGRKIDLANTFEDDSLLKEEYMTVTAAEKHIRNLGGRLERFYRFKAITDEMFVLAPREFSKIGMPENDRKKALKEIEAAFAFGLVPTKYVQPPEQGKSVLQRIVSAVPYSDERLTEAEDALEDIKAFYEKYNVYTNVTSGPLDHAGKVRVLEHDRVLLAREHIPTSALAGRGLKDVIAKARTIDAFKKKKKSPYQKLTKALCKKIKALDDPLAYNFSGKNRLGSHAQDYTHLENLDDILAQKNVLLSNTLVTAINTHYDAFTKQLALGDASREKAKKQHYDLLKIAERVDALAKGQKKQIEGVLANPHGVLSRLRDPLHEIKFDWLEQVERGMSMEGIVLAEGLDLYKDERNTHFDLYVNSKSWGSHVSKALNMRKEDKQSVMSYAQRGVRVGPHPVPPMKQGQRYALRVPREKVAEVIKRCYTAGNVWLNIFAARA